MTHEEMTQVLGLIEFQDYQFKVVADADGAYLQAFYEEDDIVTGKPEMQFTRKWKLSEHMTKSEFVQTAFKCCLTSMEHRTREAFFYRGRRIFGPHFNVDVLWDICAAPGAHDCRPALPEPEKDGA